MPSSAKAILRRQRIERVARIGTAVALALVAIGSFSGVIPRHDAGDRDGSHQESRR